MLKKTIRYLALCFILAPALMSSAQSSSSGTKYHNVKEVQQMLKEIQQKNAVNTRLHTIATSPGGEPVTILEIGSSQTGVPAIFVGANFEGNIPISTEGALRLAKMLTDSASYTEGLKWYIMPNPNPDAAKSFFAGVKYGRSVNDFEINNDVDESVNEDGYDDLNGDGYITQMRVKSPDGTHLISKNDLRIMVRADAGKGERGEYNIYLEGIDNDGDGQFNEDGEGGINVGIAFPHLFPAGNKEAGLYPGQTPEVYGILRFIFDRPEIAMVYTMGSSNFCLVPPKGGRKGEANLDRIKLPGRYARMLNADENQTFTMDEVIEMVKEVVPAGMEVTPSMVAGMLGLGAVVNPLEDDLKFYSKFSVEYKEYLKAKKFSIENLDPEPAKDGSFELWAYYHLGVPSFSMNLFSAPKVKEEKNEEDNSISLEEVEKKSIEKEGELSDREKALLAWSEKEWDGNGFVEWEKFQHPDLGEVEIGGFVPYLETTPKPEHVDSLLAVQLPWLLQLTKKMPEISFAKEELTELGSGVYKLELFVENNGTLSYPIAMGQRNRQPAPLIVVLDGDFEILEGLKRTPLGSIGGNQVRKFTWLISTNKKAEISAKLESAVFGEKVKQIKIGG
ncbi:MAG: hypothetical protein K0B11_04715 [Mariniphaga sp.]|nr:hypothetical protein [Mariniphaga sp.]